MTHCYLNSQFSIHNLNGYTYQTPEDEVTICLPSFISSELPTHHKFIVVSEVSSLDNFKIPSNLINEVVMEVRTLEMVVALARLNPRLRA